MRRFFIAWIVITMLVIIGVAYSWFKYPAWQNPTSGGFWALVLISFVTVWKGAREVIGLWKDLKDDVKEEILVLPNLGLVLINEFGQSLDEIVFNQTVKNQDFQFGIALINTLEGSVPAEKLDIRIECSWNGTSINTAPRFRTDPQNRTTQGWDAPREFIQQGEQPYPAVLSFHGTDNDRCAYGQPLEWHRFLVVLAERMSGQFLLNYRISSASPRVEAQGVLKIRINSEEFGTKSIVLNDILSGEKLNIKFNLETNRVLC